MATYTQYSQSWLEDSDSIKIVLVVVQVYSIINTTTTTLYFSNAGYVTSDGLISFDAIIRRNVTLSETLSEDGTGAMTFGDIELDNQNGELDQYLDSAKYVWSNKSIKIYYGDPRWLCNSAALAAGSVFLTIFDGLVDDIDSRARSCVNLKTRDKLERLNTPVTEDKLGTVATWPDQQNQDSLKPLIFGECFNTSPLLINPPLSYQFNNGVTESLIEVRDNGVPIYNASITNSGITVSLAAGTFTLPYQALGTVTCSVQGLKSTLDLSTGNTVAAFYSNKIADLIVLIVTQYGKGASGSRPSSRLTTSELDLTNLNLFNLANPHPVASVITETQNVLDVCRALANSVMAQVFITRSGKLQLLQYGVPYPSAANIVATPALTPTVTSITESDILYNSLMISSRPGLQAAVKLGYGKNYTVQNNLLTAIPESHKSSFSEEWLTVSKTDSAVAATYNLTTEVDQIDTRLVSTGTVSAPGATQECERRLAFYKTQSMVYKFTGISKLLGLQLGQGVTLTHSRFNLSTGKTGQVISLSPNWTTGTIEVEVLI